MSKDKAWTRGCVHIPMGAWLGESLSLWRGGTEIERSLRVYHAALSFFFILLLFPQGNSSANQPSPIGGMSSSALLRLAGWSYLPDFATKQALQFAYNTSLPIPPRYRPNPAKHPRNYRLTFAFICLTYLTYTLVSSLLSIPPNFYEILHTSPNADDAALKTAFRTFAKVYHPDRRGGEGEQWFAEVRSGYEALRDPIVRFAYDRQV